MSSPANHILVDANIARSTTDPARHPTSEACLRLVLVLASPESSTGVAMTPSLFDEWRRHASRYMTSWLASMESRRRVRHEEDRRIRDLREAVSSVSNEGIRAALEKDIHLSESAIWNGLPVASQDDKQRKFLAELASDYELAGRVQWMNPVNDGGDWVSWLHEGCVDRSAYTCGGRSS